MFNQVNPVVVIQLPNSYGIAVNIRMQDGKDAYAMIYTFEGLNDIPFIAEAFSDMLYHIAGQLPFNTDAEPLARFWEDAISEAFENLERYERPDDYY